MRALGLCLLLVPLAAPADIDESAYAAGAAVREARAREALRAGLAAEAECERQRAAAAVEHAARQRAEAAAREAARPLGERLAERHCTRCHAAADYADVRHTALFWWLVVARMVWVNEAGIPFAEQRAIVGHLAGWQGADAAGAALEYGSLAASLLLVAGLFRGGRRWRRRQRTKEGSENAD